MFLTYEEAECLKLVCTTNTYFQYLCFLFINHCAEQWANLLVSLILSTDLTWLQRVLSKDFQTSKFKILFNSLPTFVYLEWSPWRIAQSSEWFLLFPKCVFVLNQAELFKVVPLWSLNIVSESFQHNRSQRKVSEISKWVSQTGLQLVFCFGHTFKGLLP